MFTLPSCRRADERAVCPELGKIAKKLILIKDQDQIFDLDQRSKKDKITCSDLDH